MKYIKPLDGLRAVAVICVIISHWLYEFDWVKFFPFGEVGVDIFFVISGFLITSILLKNQSGPSDHSRLKTVRQFVLRRALRIFPIYYITLFVLYLFADKTNTAIREDFIYYLTYTSNINFYNKVPGMVCFLISGLYLLKNNSTWYGLGLFCL